MKKALIWASAAMLAISCNNSSTKSDKNATDVINNSSTASNPAGNADAANAPMISFEETEKNIGTVNEGEKVEMVFKFKNNGKQPLLIKNVMASCGCTVPEWPKEPFEPGQEGQIKAVFDSNNKPGNIEKSITVSSNSAAPNSEVALKFHVTVIPKAEKDINK